MYAIGLGAASIGKATIKTIITQQRINIEIAATILSGLRASLEFQPYNLHFFRAGIVVTCVARVACVACVACVPDCQYQSLKDYEKL